MFGTKEKFHSNEVVCVVLLLKPWKLISSYYNLSELGTSPNTNQDPNPRAHLIQSSNKGNRGSLDYGVLKDCVLALSVTLLLRLR